MQALLLAAVVAASPAPEQVETCPSHQKMIEQLAAEVETGTLLFSQGDCLAVKVFSGSSYTHVAAVLVEDGEPWVFDSTNGVGVRKQRLADYVTSQAPDSLSVFQPTFRFHKKLAQPYAEKLKHELGRPYAVKHHLTGNRCEGLHCAEYVTDALMAPDIIRAKQPPKVSPGSLLDGITAAELYRPALTLNLQRPEPPPETSDSWCGQMWLDTKECCSSCWSGFRRSVFCR